MVESGLLLSTSKQSEATAVGSPERPPVVPDLSEFVRNRRKIPWELVEKFGGKSVAWDLKGEQILAAADDIEALERELVKMGIDPSQVVLDYIDPPGTAWI
jgi:hypothetical protein